MQIYLMRHAEAVELGEWKGPDRSRPLTAVGEAKLVTVVEHMKRLKLSADVLLTSPYVRAVQTADVLAENLHVLQTLRCSELAAGARLDAFLSLIRQHAAEPSLWFVSHMPEISAFASRLTGDPAALESGFRPAEILAAECSLDGGSLGAGRLLWRRRVEDWPGASS